MTNLCSFVVSTELDSWTVRDQSECQDFRNWFLRKTDILIINVRRWIIYYARGGCFPYHIDWNPELKHFLTVLIPTLVGSPRYGCVWKTRKIITGVGFENWDRNSTGPPFLQLLWRRFISAAVRMHTPQMHSMCWCLVRPTAPRTKDLRLLENRERENVGCSAAAFRVLRGYGLWRLEVDRETKPVLSSHLHVRPFIASSDLIIPPVLDLYSNIHRPNRLIRLIGLPSRAWQAVALVCALPHSMFIRIGSTW